VSAKTPAKRTSAKSLAAIRCCRLCSPRTVMQWVYT